MEVIIKDNNKKKIDVYSDGLPEGEVLFNTGLQTVSVANANKPDNDNVFVAGAVSGYDQIRTYESLNRLSPLLTIINFGAGALYIIYSANGKNFSEQEIYLPAPTTYRDYVWVTIRNVYEARIRSPNAATQYMALEGYYK